MKLDVIVDEQTIAIYVPDAMIAEAEPVFSKMDADMDRGWQISRHWVDNPDRDQRCKIAADKILGALELENREMATMMAAYILARAPETTAVHVSTNGEIEETLLITENHASRAQE